MRRDKADLNLDASIKDFFQKATQVSGDDIADPLITELGNNRVKMLNDTLVTDYIEVDFWKWEDLSNDDEDQKDPNTDESEPEPVYYDDDYSDDWYQEAYGLQNKLYFLMAESRNDPATDPLIIWLQGGPGCSSMLGIYTENGPFNYRYESSDPMDPFRLDHNPYSWNNNANVMYVDQPLGTGFSFSDTTRWSEDGITDDFTTFLHNFMVKYPEFQGRELFITGESYAGHYIPNIARQI